MPRDRVIAEPLTASLHQLSRDGRSWIEAEAALAKAEFAADGKRIVMMLVMVSVVFGCLFAAVLLLSAFAVSLLAPYVNGLANAAGVLGLALLILAAVLGWRIRLLASTGFGALAVFKRWWNLPIRNPEPKT
jgi:Putative Actinobacterial Holin-X, holin superfamily III